MWRNHKIKSQYRTCAELSSSHYSNHFMQNSFRKSFMIYSQGPLWIWCSLSSPLSHSTRIYIQHTFAVHMQVCAFSFASCHGILLRQDAHNMLHDAQLADRLCTYTSNKTKTCYIFIRTRLMLSCCSHSRVNPYISAGFDSKRIQFRLQNTHTNKAHFASTYDASSPSDSPSGWLEFCGSCVITTLRRRIRKNTIVTRHSDRRSRTRLRFVARNRERLRIKLLQPDPLHERYPVWDILLLVVFGLCVWLVVYVLVEIVLRVRMH